MTAPSLYLEALPQRSAAWEQEADCYGARNVNEFLDTAWINKDHPNAAEAVLICKQCPVRMKCLEDAIADDKAEGLRGGFFFDRGAVSRKDGKIMEAELGITPRTRTKSRKPEES